MLPQLHEIQIKRTPHGRRVVTHIGRGSLQHQYVSGVTTLQGANQPVYAIAIVPGDVDTGNAQYVSA